APGGSGRRARPARFPAVTLLSISPFGRAGPYSGGPATVARAGAGSGWGGFRGRSGGEPSQSGGRLAEWMAGAYGAVGALAAVRRARRCGQGEWIDLSLLEAMTLASTIFVDLLYRLRGAREFAEPAQTVATPSIEPTMDGWVGFCTGSAQQFADFLVLIERPDLQDDAVLREVWGRRARFAEWNAIVRAWTTRHTTADIVERAARLRIPVAPVLNGDTVRQHPQFV